MVRCPLMLVAVVAIDHLPHCEPAADDRRRSFVARLARLRRWPLSRGAGHHPALLVYTCCWPKPGGWLAHSGYAIGCRLVAQVCSRSYRAETCLPRALLQGKGLEDVVYSLPVVLARRRLSVSSPAATHRVSDPQPALARSGSLILVAWTKAAKASPVSLLSGRHLVKSLAKPVGAG